jgi:hypothetical protein
VVVLPSIIIDLFAPNELVEDGEAKVKDAELPATSLIEPLLREKYLKNSIMSFL